MNVLATEAVAIRIKDVAALTYFLDSINTADNFISTLPYHERRQHHDYTNTTVTTQTTPLKHHALHKNHPARCYGTPSHHISRHTTGRTLFSGCQTPGQSRQARL